MLQIHMLQCISGKLHDALLRHANDIKQMYLTLTMALRGNFCAAFPKMSSNKKNYTLDGN